MTVSAAVLGQEESSEPRPRCNWNAFTLECEDPPPTATPTPTPPRPQPPKPKPNCDFNPSTFTWECPEPTATNTPRPTATDTPRATETPRPTPRPRPTARPATATPTPASRGWLTASQTTIDVGGLTTVTASWEPPGLATWLGIASDSTEVLWRSSRCSGTSSRDWEPEPEARLTVYGCRGGTGTVELRAVRSTGTLLASITITVRTPTPTPPPDSAPRGELSATKTAVDVGETVTVSAVNVSPSNQSVYIVTNGQLDFARPGTCHFEINPRSSEKSARSWTLEGCSPPGSGSVTLKTRHNGQTLVLDSITIDVRTPPTPTAEPTATTTTPVVVPTATTTTPVVEPTATTTDTVDPCRTSSDSRAKCTTQPTPTPTPTPTPRPTTLDTPGNVTSTLGPGAGTITLSWDAVTDATGYEVEQKVVKRLQLDEWKPLLTITGTQAVVGGLENDKSYDHRVRAVSAHGESEWAEVTTDLSERLKPRGLSGTVTPSSIGEITLQWSAVSVATRYEVQQKVKDPWWDFFGWFDDWEILPFENVDITITGTKAVVGNLRYGATYEHQVRSLNAAGPSGWSASVKTDLSLAARGHQQDHTVRYMVAPMSATPDPGFPNPATIFPPAVPTAVAAWNARISADGFLICKAATGSCDQTNADRHTMTVRLLATPNACGGIACVRPQVGGIANHRGDGEIILEERPVDSTNPRAPNRRYRWTDVPRLHNTYVPWLRGQKWVYVGTVLIHEFGHPLGPMTSQPQA